MAEKILFTPEGEDAPVEFFVLETTTVGGVNYILVTEEEEGDGEAYILKDLSKPEDEEAVYSMVEDETEFEAIGDVFSNILDDVELEK